MNFYKSVRAYIEKIKTTADTAGFSTADNRKRDDSAEPSTNATTGTIDQQSHALQCSDGGRGALADSVVLIGRLEHTRPDIAAELIRAFNTVEAAEHAGNQADFDFALEVLRAAVDDAATLTEKESEVLYMHRLAMQKGLRYCERVR